MLYLQSPQIDFNFKSIAYRYKRTARIYRTLESAKVRSSASPSCGPVLPHLMT